MQLFFTICDFNFGIYVCMYSNDWKHINNNAEMRERVALTKTSRNAQCA